MKKILYTLTVAAAALLASCQKPHYVLPTAERASFTSLSAYIVSGDYDGDELAKLTVTDDMVRDGQLVIPVPYYYPETSENSTAKYMSELRIKAEIGVNCRISPALTILDLDAENEFTFTDADGKDWPIVISGVRKKSDEATFVSFSLVDMFEAFVDNEARKIWLYTTDDLSSCTAEAEVSAHSSIVTDLSVPRNYNEPQTIVIASHSGKEYEYVTEKATPTKIRSGFNKESVKQIFNFDPKSRLGTPDYFTADLYPALALVGGNLVVYPGDGSTPFYLNGTTGAKLGDIALGSVALGSLTNDEAGNMLLCNSLDGRGKLQIYRTNSVTSAPTLFYEYDNDVPLPVGRRIKVSGNIDGDAVITLVYFGVSGVTQSSQFLSLTVKGGAVTDAEVIDLAPAGFLWGGDLSNSAGVVAASSDTQNGYFSMYYDRVTLDYVDASGALKASMPTSNGNKWGWNTNGLDCKLYNNVNYLAMMSFSHFPAWGISPTLYVYNVTDKTALTGEFDSEENPALVLSSEVSNSNKTNASATVSCGDIVMGQSADGFKIFIYYYDQYAGAIGGYSADCIKRN